MEDGRAAPSRCRQTPIQVKIQTNFAKLRKPQNQNISSPDVEVPFLSFSIVAKAEEVQVPKDSVIPPAHPPKIETPLQKELAEFLNKL